MTTPSAAELVEAAVLNHQSWSAIRAGLTGGSSAERAGGQLSLLHGTVSGGDEVEVLFAAPTDAELPDLLDEVEDLVEHRDGEHAPMRSVGWWSASRHAEATLGPHLLARGFQWGWAPHWMGLDPAGRPPRRDRFVPPAGIEVRPVVEVVDWDVPSLPNHDRSDELLVGRLAQHDPPTTTLAAFDADGSVVGKIVVHLAVDAPDNAGIYACGVVPEQRGRGIGAALTAAAVDRAAELGCHVVTLNATDMGEPVYRRVGFVSAGWGRTWWLTGRQLGTPRPAAELVALVEAIGFGHVEAVEASLSSPAGRDLDLDAELRCGLTPVGVAVQFGRAETAQQLVDHGATLDVVSAWDLGWRDRVPDLLRRDPALADRRSGEHGATPLMIAVDRDDADLARVVLAADPDLTLRDRTFRSDALGWATHLDRPHLARLIRDQSGRQP